MGELEAQEAELSSSESQDQDSNNTNEEKTTLTDLAEIGKFRFEGKDWTAEDLRKSMMFHSDYTKKSQALAEEKKYADNLAIDLAHVMKNPALAEEFKKIYPTRFHALVEQVLSGTQQQAQQPLGNQLNNQGQAGKTQVPIPKEFEQRISQIESHFMESQVKAAEAQLDSLFTKMASKYPLADEEVVISRAMALMDKGHSLKDAEGRPDENVWAKIWEASQTSAQKRYEGHYKKQVGEQKQAAVKAKDVASGGGIPGQAPKKMTLKEAGEEALRVLSNRS